MPDAVVVATESTYAMPCVLPLFRRLADYIRHVAFIDIIYCIESRRPILNQHKCPTSPRHAAQHVVDNALMLPTSLFTPADS